MYKDKSYATILFFKLHCLVTLKLEFLRKRWWDRSLPANPMAGTLFYRKPIFTLYAWD